MTLRPLSNGWSLTGPNDIHIGATVPGCVHTDLLAAGLIPDPFLDDNENQLGWIGRADWTYETTFQWTDTGAERVDLVCDGLDTVATLTVNGTEVGRTANMHRGYRFPVALHDGENHLRIAFESPYRYAERWRDELGDRPNAYPQPFNFIRKMACNFGWDWGPNLVTAGIWRPIALHSWTTARLARVRPLVTVDEGTGRIELHVDLERTDDTPLRVEAAIGDVRTEVTVHPGQSSAVLELEVINPALWWPRGYGDQARYPLEINLSTGDETLDTWHRQIGFRSVKIDTAPDEHGSAFTVVVNDVPVFARGVNWIPDDPFPSRIDRERYATRLRQASAAGVNFVRIWGGGIYESDDFYDVADELGLLVAQDFLFACAAYPEEQPLWDEVAAEARHQVTRLLAHPSLVMWTGNNENLWGYADWDWPPKLDGRTWGENYYHELLPRIVAELDPTRPYWPGSPYSGDRNRHPNDPNHGTMHIWDVWNTDDYLRYRDYTPRFVAEFGYQGPPAYATLRRALSDDPLASDSPGMRHHQKAIDGDAKLQRGLDAHLPAPRDFDDWHYLTQLNQARAVSVGVEHLRGLYPRCMGAVVWQLNDCWPVTSWAAVDGAGRRKPLWYALRRSYADRLLTIQPRDGGLALVAVNDGPTQWTVEVAVTRLTISGEPRGKTSVELSLGPREATTVPLPADVSTPDDPTREVLLADANGQRAWWFFAEDKDVAYPPAEYEAIVEPTTDGGQRVTVTAHTILRDVVLYPDRLDPAAEVDDALVTLLPGESHTFVVHCGQPFDPVRPFLRCVNDLMG
ncbi:MAG TPA: glycoside hydrolase family 2 protein [Micromonosporaceae bacterium]|nr:glycoside hydrolase family 2 protein [Micromonosporaceae bacterium]